MASKDEHSASKTRRESHPRSSHSPSQEHQQLLWSILRGRQLAGLKFRRQHPIEPYIVDLYCADAKLIVELDGESHNGREDFDKQRSVFLAGLGLKVFRVTNDDALTNLGGVAEGIARVARLG